jgi:TatA/E family protein of Tat protein translocase
MSSLLIGDLGTPELLIIFAIVILVFGASKLPELARGSGRLPARARVAPGVRARGVRGTPGRGA